MLFFFMIFLLFTILIYMKSNSILLFLLNIEILMISMAGISYYFCNIFFIFILLMGVIEAIIGLSLLINFSRFFGNDMLKNF